MCDKVRSNDGMRAKHKFKYFNLDILLKNFWFAWKNSTCLRHVEPFQCIKIASEF